MSKKTAAIVIALLVLLIGAGLFFFYWYTKSGIGGGPEEGDGGAIIFPRGDSVPGSKEPGREGAGGEPSTPPRVGNVPRLRQLTETPVSGAVVFTRGGKLVARYIDRGTGHTYELDLGGLKPVRITNTTIPKIYEALWRSDGKGVVLRYLKDGSDTIETFAANLPATSTAVAVEIEGSFLPAGIRTIAVSPTTNRMFYMTEGESGGRGFLQEWGQSRRVEIFTSPLREWLAAWQREGVVEIASRPSVGVLGHLYFVDAKSGAQTRALANVPGLTALSSPGGNLIFYTESGESVVSHVFSSAKRATTDLIVTTFPEKCVWGRRDPSALYCAVPKTLPSGEYPDGWYRGELSFEDEIWKIEGETGAAERVSDVSGEARKGIDAVNFSIAPDDDLLLFINKRDLTLWALELK